jgi:RHS repeat-associated protein
VFKKTTILFVFILVLFAFISPASADYLGPDREVTTASEVCKVVLRECKQTGTNTFKYIRADQWSCASEGKEWQAYDNSSVACDDLGDVGRTQWDKEYSVSTTTITHPEATITGTLQNCTLQNGWCVTAPQLEITSNEPLSGYQIILIEGTRNNEIFACPELQTNCSIPFLEGQNNFEYWAISSWGDSSRKGTSNVKVDTVAPNLNLIVNGTLGQNNWYTSGTIITAFGEDSTSGIYEKVLSIDNGNTWIPETTLTDGVYQVDIRITDNALNISSASTTIQVDSTTPTLSLSVTGTQGQNNYYVSKPKITATTADATSGVALVQAKIDNGNWIDTNEVTLEDGIHTYLNHFTQPDSIVPDPYNPQDWDRYSYARNNPLKYTDPTGHIPSSCGPDNIYCGGLAENSYYSKPAPNNNVGKVIKPEKDNNECETVTCKAFNGDILSIIDLLFPTHGGIRIQGELSLFIISGSIGVNFLYNRVQDRLVANLDWAGELGPSVPELPGGISITAGPLFGWGSSNVEDIATGSYLITSASAAGGPALSAAVTASPMIDEKYGQVPFTVYLGGGAGCCYAGIGGGGGSTFGSVHYRGERKSIRAKE